MSRRVVLATMSLAAFVLLSIVIIATPSGEPALAAAAPADQTTILMKVTGARQGDINGGSTLRGHEGWIGVLALSHEIVSPRDPASGLPTGKRQHKPFVITKEIDKATPLLFKALTDNENVTTVLLEFFKTDPTTGKEVTYYTIELRNASIAGIQTQGPAAEVREQVSFVYQKIIWTWTDGGVTFEDNWTEEVA